VSGATSATFVYDGDGNRVKEVSYENVAAGIRATSSSALNWPDVVTNGDTWADSGSGSSGEFAYTAQTGLQYVQLDLGAVYSVDKVRVWHYAADGRIYNATKTQVSADGSSWYTVFDSAVSGTYAETAEGRTYTFTARNVRYIRDYLNGSNKNAGNHWVEIEVWGTRTTAYVGAHYEKNVTANTTTSYYYAAGQRVAMRVSGSGAGVVYYLHGDHLGSASVTTDASGAKVGELRYYPYGGTRYIGGVTRTDRRFTGQIEDAAIGLYFYNARFYDPYLGRFISADTVVPEPGNPQSLNRFSYVGNNPLKYVDPSGHFPWGPVIAGAVVVGGVVAFNVHYGPHPVAAMFGNGPDSRGIRIAQAHQSLIVDNTTEQVPPIMLAGGIAIQAQWSGFPVDTFEGIKGDPPEKLSQGIAQIMPSEVATFRQEGYIIGGNPASDPGAAVQAMYAKIHRSVAACTGCSVTDQFVVAAIAQNGFSPETVGKVLEGYGNGDGTINWGRYFATLDAPSGGWRAPFLAYRSGGRSWYQFHLQLFVNDLQALIGMGWTLPEGVNLEYMQCVASGAVGCAR
jgi:RHS repeat-associated protein